MILAELFPYSRLIFTILYGITAVAIVGVVVSENRNPVKTLAWITVLVLLPVAGIVLYIFFGRSLKHVRMISRKKRRKLIKRDDIKHLMQSQSAAHDELPIKWQQMIKLVNSIQGSPYLANNEVQIFTNGRDKFEAYKRDLLLARNYIHIQYYIIENDNIGNEIATILKQKVQEGVKVRVLYDHVGSFHFDMSYFKKLRRAGVDVYPFMKITFPEFANRINWRNHRKITVIDGEVGYIGGMNIADRYVTGGKMGHWRDTHLRVKGDVVAAMQVSFAIDWNFMKRELIEESVPVVDPASISNPVGVQLVTGGPTSQWGNMAFVFQKAIENARKSIYIQTPYFLPSDSLLKALQVAALSKVDVRLMIPRKPDSFLLRYASYSYVKQCLDAGIKIYFYEPGMLHAKVVVIDDEFVTTGSTNFDFRSFEHNFEGNLLLYSKDFNQRMTRIMHDDMMQSTRISLRAWRRRSMWQKALESLTRLFGPLL
ncbi:MAG: cardiolipin synthase [Muribaculaceae bacterium]|nr:cardiolipin synthase [Muribaculaceae bacterium]MBQ2563421.1 cardiolipin synthase [Muribaculaceae bacterium]MBQ5409283.1 cardiolipin synthase [Muribaculaceae bacterium]MBQ5508987.1 cardiolipin synthase [Muribaculaceae bacterium]